MRIIKPRTVRGYIAKHPTARASLTTWLAVTARAEWQSIIDVRALYPTADAVTVDSGKTVTVFNIADNNVRLVVAIHYNWGKVFIREFLTHAAYDRQAWTRRN